MLDLSELRWRDFHAWIFSQLAQSSQIVLTRPNPDQTRNNNYSTRGNVNPYTSKAGTKPREGE